jgi:ribonucleoside-diphosphate reductase alpha chain
VRLGKQGSTLAGVMDAFSMSISVGLQYGIPLEFYVGKFKNLRFEPAGMTDDPDIHMATSIVDYLFRRLALNHLAAGERLLLGVQTADERSAEVEAGYGEGSSATALDDVRTGLEKHMDAPVVVSPSTAELVEHKLGVGADAPLCMTCGTKMRPAGSCYACEGCGATSGCS